MSIYFISIQDVFKYIRDNSFNREYAREIANAYIFEENDKIEFDGKLFDGYGFLFQFLLIEQNDLSDKYFKKVIKKISSLNFLDTNFIEIKKILYEKQLNELKSKYDKKFISEETYKNQVDKYLD